MASVAQRTFSFAEIVQGRDSSVRVTDDGFLYAVDLVMVVMGCDGNYAGQVLRRLPEETFPSCKLHERRFPGKGNANIKILTFKDAIELVMVLPGKGAKEIRTKFADIIRRYLAGDRSLLSEIETNAQSNAPIAQLARAATEAGLEEPEDSEARRKRLKREDLELVRLEQEVQDKRIQNLSNFMGLMTRIRPDWMETDARFRLQTEDIIKNIITTSPYGQPLTITNGSQPASLSVSQLAQELGCRRLSHGDLCRVGVLAAKRYRALHGNADPPTHRQWVDGAERLVRSYTEADRVMLTKVFHDLGLVRSSSPRERSLDRDIPCYEDTGSEYSSRQ